MNQSDTGRKIRKSGRWQKFPLTAILIAAAVHLLLLVLFRAPGNTHGGNIGETAGIIKIDLTRPENYSLAQWIENHDPALMTRADKTRGYSSVLSDVSVHTAPDDLPSVPVLSTPSMPAAAAVKLLDFQGDLIPAGPAGRLPDKKFFRAEKDAIHSPLLEQITLSLMNSNSKITLAAPVTAAVTLLPARLGVIQEPELTVSSQNPVLDKIAVSAAKIFMDKCAPENRNGVLTFVWRAGAFENSGEKK